MPWCMSLTARTPPMFRDITTATMNPTWRGTSFLKITRRYWRGSTNGFTAWKIMPLMCANTDKLTWISSSRGPCWHRPLTMEGIDERSNLHGFRDDGCGGRPGVERGAHCFRRRRPTQYRLQPGALYRRTRSGAHLRVRGLRGPSRTSAFIHRRSDPGERCNVSRLHGRPVWVVFATGFGRGRVARRRPDRS